MVIVTSFYSPIPEAGERGQETTGKPRTSEGGRVWRSAAVISELGYRNQLAVG